MKEVVFRRAYTLCKSVIADQRNLTAEDASALGVEMQSLQSLRRQMFTKFIRRTTHKHTDNKEAYVERWRGGDSIATISGSAHYSPYLMARLITQELQPQPAVVELMRNPSLIHDERLAADVRECLACDLDYSVAVDTVKLTVGLEFEYRLQAKLEARGAPFESESDLRERGMAKTPDFMLLVPMAVRDPATGRWHIVTWIDSKAMFGYPEGFEEQLPQLQGYVNRIGPGMVVYWFDCVETLNSPAYASHSADIYVSHGFPDARDTLLPDDPEDTDLAHVATRCGSDGGAGVAAGAAPGGAAGVTGHSGGGSATDCSAPLPLPLT